MSTSHTSRPSKIPLDLLQFLDGAVIINPRFFYKIYQGFGFSISHRFDDVANGSSADVYFENPAGSGRDVFLMVVEVIATGQCHVDVYRANTVNVAGTPLTPVNLNFKSGVSSVANVEHGGTYTTGTLTLNTVCPGGFRVRAVGGAAEVGETAVIPPGFNFLVRVTNESGANADLSIRIIWWEESL